MAEIAWEDPPAIIKSGGAPQKWAKLLSPVMERPGCWARIAEYATASVARTTASNLRHRKVVIPDGVWEFVAREGRVYARYVGPS